METPTEPGKCKEGIDESTQRPTLYPQSTVYTAIFVYSVIPSPFRSPVNHSQTCSHPGRQRRCDAWQGGHQEIIGHHEPVGMPRLLGTLPLAADPRGPKKLVPLPMFQVVDSSVHERSRMLSNGYPIRGCAPSAIGTSPAYTYLGRRSIADSSSILCLNSVW